MSFGRGHFICGALDGRGSESRVDEGQESHVDDLVFGRRLFWFAFAAILLLVLLHVVGTCQSSEARIARSDRCPLGVSGSVDNALRLWLPH